MPQPVEAVANWFLDRAETEGKTLDPLKLQKLLYFAQGWHLVLAGHPLIDELFEAWDYGPVLPSIYHAFQDVGADAIRARACRLDPVRLVMVTPRLPADAGMERLLEQVWVAYGGLTGLELSHLTHQPGSPWKQTRRQSGGMRNAGIPNALIGEEFARRARGDD